MFRQKVEALRGLQPKSSEKSTRPVTMADVASQVHQMQVVAKKRTKKKKLREDEEIDDSPLLCEDHQASSSFRQHPRIRLLQYFVCLSTEGHPLHGEALSVDRIQQLLEEGAEVNAADKHGQTVMHEVACQWNPTIARFLCELGADVNVADNNGRRPLHVAAGADFPDMCRALIDLGADKEALDTGNQTPLFYAAKTDSARALKVLLMKGCRFDGIHDWRGRTPLYVAAELDRSVTAESLVDQGADAFVSDSTGQIAFVSMVEKMPQVARLALRRLHKRNRMRRKQKLRLFRLDPRELPEDADNEEIEKLLDRPQRSAMKAITSSGNYEIVQSPVVQNYVEQQWLYFGRIRAVTQLLLQFVTIVLWTIFAVAKEWTQRFEYKMPDDIYRIVILTLAALLNVYNIVEEILEFLRESKRHQAWQKWRLDNLAACQSHCRRRDEEFKYLESEIEAVKSSSVAYFSDAWNYLDWTCYLVLVAALIVHFIDVGFPGGRGNLPCARWHVRLMAVAIVLLWMRLLKYWKPFEFFGPFIVMLGVLFNDFVKFFLLYLEFFIPFCCMFWTLLGGVNMQDSDISSSATLTAYNAGNYTKATVQYFDTVNNMIFSVFRITLVDEYDFDTMSVIDPGSAQVLVAFWLALSAILMLNLFIAQLSETFKAVYDNAKAAALMQKAITIQEYYESMLTCSKVKYHRMLKRDCNPLVLPYDDDETAEAAAEIQKATLDIRDTVTEMSERLGEYCAAQQLEEEEDLQQQQEGEEEGHKKQSKRRLMADSISSTHRRIELARSSINRELVDFQQLLADVACVVSAARGGNQGAQRA